MSTLANSNQKKRRLEGKDFITIGIYTVIYMVITTLVAILGFIPIYPIDGGTLSVGRGYSIYALCYKSKKVRYDCNYGLFDRLA